MSAPVMMATHAAVRATMNAIRACGVLVRLEPAEFAALLRKSERPLVVLSMGGWFTASYRYVTPYRGLTFHCKSPTPVELPSNVELIDAARISIPEI
jgi:hypothetical protein